MLATQAVSPAIQVERLLKRYGSRNAVDDITFSVRQGEIFGLLGPNGAGKTTTIGILTTSVLPTSGQAFITGIDVVADPLGVKQRIAVMPQQANLDRSLRVRDILTLHAAYHGVPRALRNARADRLLAELGLVGRGQEKIIRYSGGMGQRVMLARALMHEPEVLFLDEPTNNLDPQARLFLWERIRSLHRRGVTIILTTHDMNEADHLCERIAIMDRGRILALDTPEKLKRMIPRGTVLELHMRVPARVSIPGGCKSDGSASQISRFTEAFSHLPGVVKAESVTGPDAAPGSPEEQTYRLYLTEETDELVMSVYQAIAQEQGKVLDLRFTTPSLEDVFIYLTGRDLRL